LQSDFSEMDACFDKAAKETAWLKGKRMTRMRSSGLRGCSAPAYLDWTKPICAQATRLRPRRSGKGQELRGQAAEIQKMTEKMSPLSKPSPTGPLGHGQSNRHARRTLSLWLERKAKP